MKNKPVLPRKHRYSQEGSTVCFLNVLDSGAMRSNNYSSGYNQMSMQGSGGMPFFGGGNSGGSRGGELLWFLKNIT